MIKRPLRPIICLASLLAVGGVGCASLGFGDADSSGASSGSLAGSGSLPGSSIGSGAVASGAAEPMTVHRLEQIFADQVDAITGSTGALQTQMDGFAIYCISDPNNDRMRIFVPITRLTGLDPRIQEVMLRANFHSALDARYAVSEDVIFAAFIHPISSLTPELIVSGLNQVVTLAKTFGTTYTSGQLAFPGSAGEGGEQGEAEPQ